LQRSGQTSITYEDDAALTASSVRSLPPEGAEDTALARMVEVLPGVLCQAYRSPSGEIEFRTLRGNPTSGIDLRAALEDPQHLLDRVDPRDRPALAATLATAARDLTSWTLDFRMRTSAGELRWISARANPQRLANGGTLFSGMALDVTAQKRTEATLAASEARYRELFDSSPILMHTVDATGRIASVNRSWLSTLGYKAAEALGCRTQDILAPESQREFAEQVSLAGGDSADNLECQLLRKDGGVVDVIMSVRLEKDPMDAIVGASFYFADVTDRNRALSALEESQARYRAVVQDQTEAICRFDPQGVLQFVNYACARLAGKAVAELLGTQWFDLIDEGDRDGLKKRLPELLTPDRPLLGMELPTGRQGFWYQWSIRGFFDEENKLTGYQAVGRDIQEIKELQKEVREISHREQSRIGHDLHDGLGQELTGASLLLKTLEQDARNTNPQLLGRMAALREVLDQSIATTRSLAQGLSPIDVQREGLVGALAQLAARAEAVFGIRVTFTARRKGSLADPSVAMDLYRIAQEALSNAARHAQARAIELRITLGKNAVEMEIADDGQGIDPKALHGRGMGLEIMRYRASMIGATVDIAPGELGGTVVRCTLRQNLSGKLRRRKGDSE
jgi:PAS domain S-box-containing protein